MHQYTFVLTGMFCVMITIMNSNIITNKYVYKIQQLMLYLTALSSEFIDTVLMTFVDIVFVIFVGIVFVKCVDVLSIVFEILLRTITKVSTILFRYLPFS